MTLAFVMVYNQNEVDLEKIYKCDRVYKKKYRRNAVCRNKLFCWVCLVMRYRADVDGLRAIAVFIVILFHAGLPSAAGGYIGVDIFFVISGYLITTIILSELHAGHFSIRKFYERRARRLLPALFFVLLLSVPFSLFLLAPNELRDFDQSLVSVSFFASNILFWYQSGYFALASELTPLLHTWSLAVEEQYY